MRANIFLGAIAILLFIANSGGANHCTTWTTADPEVDAGDFYVDNDPCQPGCLFSIWYYQESNGIDGLQRGDEVVDNTCHGMIDSDSIICSLLPIGLLTRRREPSGNGAPVALAGILAVGVMAAVPTASAC